MIIYDLNLFGFVCFPLKADTPLIIDTDAVLPGAIAMQLL